MNVGKCEVDKLPCGDDDPDVYVRTLTPTCLLFIKQGRGEGCVVLRGVNTGPIHVRVIHVQRHKQL